MVLTTIVLTIFAIIFVAVIVFLVRDVHNFRKRGVATIIGIVVVVVIASTCIEITDSAYTPGEETGEDTLYYNDYFETTATSAGGALELVDLNGETYAHANGLGEATLTFSDDSVQTYTVEKATIDVFLLSGQSNAAYYNSDRYDPETAEPIPPYGTAWYYGTSSLPVQYSNNYTPTNTDGLYYMTNADGSAYIGNVDLPFAGEYVEKTGHKVLVVNGARSGTSITWFVPGGNVYTFMQTAYNDAISKINTTYYNIEAKAMIWIQGENDANMEIDTYKSYFVSMFNAISGKDSDNVFSENYPLDKVLISKIRTDNGYNAALAQEQLAEEVAGVYLATELADTFTVDNGLLISDGVHYSQYGDNLIGVAVADYYAARWN